MKQKVLLIGKNSFIGKNIQAYSKYQNIDSVSLRENSPDDIEYKKYDVIILLAAIVHQTKKIPDDKYYRVNRDLPIEVAENAKNAGVKQFIFISTMKVYGSRYESQIRDETSPCYPDEIYGISKYQAELGLKQIETKQFKVSIVRTPIVYGEGEKANMKRLTRLVEMFNILPFANIQNLRNMTYVGNLVHYLDCMIDKRASGIFIVIDNESLSTTELVKTIALNLNRKVQLFKLPEFLLKIGIIMFPKIFKPLFYSLEFDNSLTKKSLECTGLISAKEGIQRMIKDYLKNSKG